MNRGNKRMLILEEKLKQIPTYSKEIGLDLKNANDRFKWFIASMLFAKRISSNIAKKTFEKFIEEKLTSIDKILDAGWDKLVEVLDSGGYVRYDFSTATNILKNLKKLKEEYGGSLEILHEKALNSKDLEKKLLEFKGFGPVAVNIFLRELRNIWDKANPKPSKLALEVAKKLNFKNIEKYESSLVRINIEYCKKYKCKECLVKEYCKK
ncbi:MAG: hypothetical protein QXR03_00785 [Candidatus Aenigmatarchaeota archaeon]